MGNGRGRGGAKSRKQQKQHQHQSSTQQHPSTPSRAKKSSSFNNTNNNSPYHPLSTTYTYNPAGYSSYDNGTRSSSSCRVIYGRVEAYTTKRAGSDKKTAYQVGENYAHEMEKLNEAVESMKRERRISGGEGSELLEEGDDAAEEQRVKEEQVKQQSERKKTRATTNATGRPRSRSVDGVTFASSPLGPLETLMEHSPHLAMFDNGEDDTTKRPLEGILKEPSSSNKRSR